MNEKEYFIIIAGEDGVDIDNVDLEELEKRLNPDREFGAYYGNGNPKIHYKFPDDFDCFVNQDTDGGKREIIIIKGKVIKPTKVEVVTKYNFD